MTATVVPYENPDQSTILLPVKTTPYSLAWWTTHTITDIPKDAYGWLLAQGWVATDVRFDETTKPPEPYYTMTRNSLQNWEILQSLLTSYTEAYNEARLVNSHRYNDVVEDWTEMLASSQVHFEAQVAEQNAHIALYLGDLVSYMATLDDLIEGNQTKLVVDAAVATTALTTLDTKLGDLETNVTTSTTTIEGLLTDQAGYLSTFLTDFAAKLAELDTNYAAHLGEIQTLLANADVDMAAFASTQSGVLTDLSAAYTAHVTQLGTLLTAAGTYLATVETDINAVLADLGTDYTDVDTEISALLTQGDTALNNHATDYNAVLSLLESDYTLHETTARDFLIDLGATDLARINEAFNATLATQIQQLVNNGLYTSAIITDVTARNARDRSEEIGILNDRLNREKLENQHHLYGQQTAMRTGTMAGKDRIHTIQQEIWRYQASQITGLYGLLQAVRDRTLTGKQAIYAIKDANNRLNIEVRSRLYAVGQEMRRVLIEEAARLEQLSQAITQWKAGQRDRLLEQVQNVAAQHLAGIERQHGAQQSVSQAGVSERNTLLAHIQDAVKGFLAGKERYSAMTMQNASTLAEHRNQMIVQKMNEIAFREAGGQRKHDETMKLMAYQLSERNQLLIGLYGFVERRSDVGPSIEDLAKICTSLSDSGGGWLTP